MIGKVIQGRLAAVLLAGISSMAMMCAAHAEEAASADKVAPPQTAADAVTADDIVVTGVQFKGTATPLKLSLSPSSNTALVTSLSGDDISRQSLGVNIDVFRSIPGVQVGDFGQVGIAQGVSLRGWPGANDSSAVAYYLDGKQWNEGSNTGANGYLDIAPIIPATLATLTVVKGPFDTRYGGNFALAGSAIATTVDYLPTGIAVSGGSYGNAQLLGVYGYEGSGASFYTAVQGIREDGYQRNANRKQLSTFSKLTLNLGEDRLFFSAQTYNIKFGSPGYLPLALIQNGTVSRRSDVDDTDGGKKNLYTFLTHYTHGDDQRGLDVTAYAEHEYRNRFATFTPYPQEYTSNNREDYGASIEPHLQFSVFNSMDSLLLVGASVRHDDIKLIRGPSISGVVTGTPDPLLIDQTQLSSYASLSMKPVDWFKVMGGARYDRFDFDIRNQGTPGSPALPTVESDTGRFSLKAGVAVQPLSSVTLIANIGQSLSSPDAGRELRSNPDLDAGVLLTKEVGISFNPWAGRFHISANYYWTKYSNEVTFVGQTAINQGQSKRRGFDVDASALAVRNDWLTLRVYGNYSYVHGRLKSGDLIPNVAKWVGSYGLHADIVPSAGSTDVIRFDIGQQLTGPQPFDAPLTFRSKTSARVSTKLSYEMPDRNNLSFWTDAIIYTKGRLDEFGFTLPDVYVTSLPRFRFHVGASVNF